MCGIVGYWSAERNETGEDLASTVTRMAATLIHRGPDDSGAWCDPNAGLALGHRRLSIIDLSACGHQPMISADGRYVIIFNGEIYNFVDLREEFERRGRRFSGHSDTEVMLAAICEWGIHRAIESFTGMFAFALWDRREECLWLGRDRLGEKPLYYGWVNKTFLFASELKALRVHPAWTGEIRRDALPLLFRYGYIPAPHSIYSNIFKLRPGHLLVCRRDGSMEESQYWSLRDVACKGQATPFGGTEDEALAEFENLLKRTVRRQMVADVPLGAFLSGGVDSSTIVALMQAQSSSPVKSFTIGFAEDAYNEAREAAEVAEILGTDHTPLLVSASDALAVIPKLPAMYDEPYADSSQIPTYLVAQLARRRVTVSLSGDGGDELMGGYPYYQTGHRLWRRCRPLPAVLRGGLAKIIDVLPGKFWSGLLGLVGVSNGDERAAKMAAVFRAKAAAELRDALVSFWQKSGLPVAGQAVAPAASSMAQGESELGDEVSELMCLDTILYLSDDILVKVDRASMAVSLESRIPMLDHHLVEFAWRLPLSMKVRDGKGKWLLRRLLAKYIPERLIERPKKGFCLPIDVWLRSSLRDWAEELLEPKRMAGQGYLKVGPIREKWRQHLAGTRNWQDHLWQVLMFQAWLEQESGNA